MFKTFPMGEKSKSGVNASLFLLYVQTFLGGVKLSAVGLPGSTPYQQRYDPRNEDNGIHFHRPR